MKSGGDRRACTVMANSNCMSCHARRADQHTLDHRPTIHCSFIGQNACKAPDDPTVTIRHPARHWRENTRSQAQVSEVQTSARVRTTKSINITAATPRPRWVGISLHILRRAFCPFKSKAYRAKPKQRIKPKQNQLTHHARRETSRHGSNRGE